MQYQPYSNMKKLVKNGLTNLRIEQELAELGGYRWDLKTTLCSGLPKCTISMILTMWLRNLL